MGSRIVHGTFSGGVDPAPVLFDEEHPRPPVAVNALRNKRADLAGQIEMHQREVDRLRAELVAPGRDAAFFDPSAIPEDIASRKRWPRRTDYFARGELTRLVFDAIRESGSTSAGELAAAAMAVRSIPESDNAIRRVSSPGSWTRSTAS